MPYTAKQHRLFEAAAHNPAVSKQAHIPMATASKMAHEGVKNPSKKAKAVKKPKVVKPKRTSK